VLLNQGKAAEEQSQEQREEDQSKSDGSHTNKAYWILPKGGEREE